MCGHVHVPHLMLALVYLTDDQPLPEDWGPLRPGLLDSHPCGDGRLGVCDLVGGEPD